MKIKLFALVVVGVLFLLFFVWIFITNVFFNKTPAPGSTVNPVPTNFNVDYSSLYKLVPGKSTLGDVFEIGGKPSSAKTIEDTHCLYYKTPSADYKNAVCLKNGVVL